jgi:ADP-heptose:LPS heptosyltransferase
MLIKRTTFLKALDATAGAALCPLLSALKFMTTRGAAGPGIAPESISRILLIRPGGLGDMMLLVPVIRVLSRRFPDAAIDLVCEKRNVEVLKLAGMEKNAMIYDMNPLKFLWLLRRRKYDVAIDAEQFHHFSAIFALWSGAPVRIGFKINPRRNPLYTHLVNYAPDGSEQEQFMRLLTHLDPDPGAYSLEGSISAEGVVAQAAKGKMPDASAPDRPFAVVHAGGSNGYKLWGIEKFAELVNTLQQRDGLGIVLVGGPDDRKLSTSLLRKIDRGDGRSVSFAGRLSLLETAAVIAQSDVFIGGDSGLAHIAVALGRPTVVLFGPSDHLKWGVEDAQRHAVVHADLPCSPCFIFGYSKPCRTVDCMKQISVENVLKACRRVLKGQP